MKTDNELIAQFMGILFDGSGQCTDLEHKYSWRPGVYDPLRVEHLQYDSNWSWLMPVIERIEIIGYYTNIFKDEDGQQTTILHPVPSYKRDIDSMIVPNDPCRGNNSKIDSTYKAVVEFIKWYNTQKQ